MSAKIHPTDLVSMLDRMAPRHPVAVDTETPGCGRMVV